MSDKKIMKTLNGYTVYDEDAHRRIDSLAGSAPGLVFDTVADMEAYVAEHSAELKVGQNLYIREVDVPDYWWDGTAAQELEVKEDLSGYAKQEEVDQLSKAIADKADKTGWAPGKYIGTDAAGNMVEKEAPQTGTGGITEETDPTVPSWAKQAQKPTYTASEVGALPASTKIPGKTSDLENDSGYITIAVATLLNYYLKTETYAKTETYSQTEIDNLISGLDNRLKAIADSDDTTLDQLSEIVAYIKSNKSLIDSITTNKVNVADIVNNLTTADAKKPLSAAQGKELKTLYDSLPSWAKESNKPSYSKSEIGLGNVDNVKQYSASNPPPYPVTSVNGKTGAVQLGAGDVGARPSTWTPSASDVGAATKEQVEQISKEIAEQQTEIDGKQPKGNYALKTELASETTEREAAVADLSARLGQQHILIAEGDTTEEQIEWLNANGDKTKAYVLKDGFIYAYIQTTEVSGASYTNVLPSAINSDGTPYVGTNGEKGYKTGYRLNSSRVEKQAEGKCCTGFIPVKYNDTIRFKNIKTDNSNLNGYIHFYGSDFAANTGMAYEFENIWDNAIVPSAVKSLPHTTAASSNQNATDKTAYFRISTAVIDETSVITINEEIIEGSTVVVEKWASTGHAFVPADYDAEIANLRGIANVHTTEINALKEAVESDNTGGNTADKTEADALKRIKEWDKPVYDSAPVTLLTDDRTKSALTASDRTVSAVYAKYRALMAKHPKYITETNLGKSTASDTFNAVDILRFDFKEPDGLVESSRYTVNETKPKIIIMSGVHNEYAGIYGAYYALEEIAENPEFDDIRRNAHIIVVPCSNPFGLTSQTAIDGWQMSHVNANGVAIHNNFGVEHNTYNANANVGEFNYGGTEPYSELETQYIDKIMAENSDAIAFISCHNYNRDVVFGSLAIWASSATAHMCNLAYRLIDKISKAWHNKYGTALQEAIETYRTDALPEGETRLGWAQFSTSAGTEQLNATKYGILATNLEISDNMRVFSDAQFSSDVMTHGAEVYANFMRTILAAYDYNDKKDYAPNLPWKD